MSLFSASNNEEVTKHQIFWFLLIMFFYATSLKSQEFINVSGFITEQDSKEVLIDAIVSSQNNSEYAFTNEYGFYTLKLQKGILHTLTSSYLGYEDRVISFLPTLDTVINFSLVSIPLQTVEVIAEKNANNYNVLENLEIRELVDMPSIGGEADILKTLSFYPGISSGQEGTSNLLVRGGSSDQNLFLLDQIPVYNVNHLGGFLSVFNADAIQNLDFYIDGFPARYAGKLSSVVDISLKEGNKNTFQGKYRIGLITSKLMVEGPLNLKRNASYLVAARSSYLGLVNLFRNSKESDNFLNYWLYDVNAKLNIPTKKGRFYLAYYTGSDNGNSKNSSRSGNTNFTFEENKTESKINWGNHTLSARYAQPLAERMFFKSALGYTKYTYAITNKDISKRFFSDTTFIETENNFEFISEIESIISRVDIDFNQSNTTNWKAGFYSEFQSRNLSSSKDEEINNTGIYLDAYLEHNIDIDKMKFSTGMRLATYSDSDSTFIYPQPRVKFVYTLNKNSGLELNYSRMVQMLHQLTLNNFGLPVDTWISPSKALKPQVSDQWSVTYKGKGKILCLYSISGFYKKQSQLIEYSNSNQDLVLVNEENINDLLSKEGSGEVYGAELFFSTTIKKVKLMSAYTVSWNYRQFEQLNNGEKFLYNYDRRHDLSVNLSYALVRNWTINGTFVFQSGSRFTAPIANIMLPNQDLPFEIFGERNNLTLPDYHRLDFSLKHTKLSKNDRLRTWEITGYNVYNRANANGIRISGEPIFDLDGNFTHLKPEIQKVSYFSFIPSISYTQTF